MAQTYVVEQGDHLSKIAAQFGFADFHAIWDDPANASLREKRKDPHILFPGDEVSIPDRTEKTVLVQTTRVHEFALKRPKLMLRLAIKDFDNMPVTESACELEIDGVVYPLVTDGDGMIQQSIPVTAREGTLRILDLDVELPLEIGHLDPVEEDRGWQGRLVNLGYLDAVPGEAPAHKLKHALEEFQCDFNLPITGLPDGKTQAKIAEVHGG
jgi:N-acetylmuramoyl-L-alanine amidase